MELILRLDCTEEHIDVLKKYSAKTDSIKYKGNISTINELSRMGLIQDVGDDDEYYLTNVGYVFCQKLNLI
jgi:hypothetical protein